MKHDKRLSHLTTSRWLLTAAALSFSLGLTPQQAGATTAKNHTSHSASHAAPHGATHPVTHAGTAGTHVATKAGRSAGAKVQAGGRKSGKSGKSGINKVAALPVISMPAPPPAVLAQTPEAMIQTGCLSLPLGPGADGQSGVSTTQLQAMMKSAALDVGIDGTLARCAPYAAVAQPAGAAGGAVRASDFAFLPADDRHALVATSLLSDGQSATHWQDLEAGLPPVREVWLQAAGLLGASVDGNDAVPPYLLHELGLLVKHMRKQAGANDNAVVRALIQGDDEDASLAAVELIDPATGQAVDSAVWVARDGEPGAYISSRGVEYERMLWQAPVDYRRISRGIGASSMLVHKRVVVQLKAKKGRKARSKVVVRAFRYNTQHIGIDYAAATGTPVVAVAEGEIVFSGWRGGYGNLVIVQHGSDMSTYYGHLSAFSAGVQEGLKVRRGQEIGLVGSTGFSTGPHLHFEVRKGTKYMDPSNLAQTLPAWTMAPSERETVLTRLLQLEVSRAQSFMRTAYAQQLDQPAAGQ